ncbi:MAG: nucleotide exchange factor GrpE [Neisseriaceae bacterium]|nr:MAG: nucleotide exchange factor GrpE [Neisseriaceae bacterium]
MSKENKQDVDWERAGLEANELDVESNNESLKNNQEQVTHSFIDEEEEPQQQINELNSQIIKLNEQILDLQQQIKDEEIRSLANIQNLQRRHKNELDDAYKYASTRFAKEMLPIKDYLEMALMDESNHFETLQKGVELTLKQLDSAFESVFIKEINSLGEVFDPNKHNAVGTEKSEEEPNTVIKVLQKGYEMNDRVLRPAMVIVASAE